METVFTVLLIVGCVVLLASQGAPLLSPDGAVYQSSAASFAGGDGFRDYAGRLVTVFPPGTAALVAGLHVLGAPFSAAWFAINASALTIWLVSADRLLRAVQTDRTARLLTLTLLGFLATSTYVFRSALSDAVFAAISAVFVLRLVRAEARRPQLCDREALSLGLIAGASFLFRYSGVVWILLALIGVAQSTRSLRLTARTALGAAVAPVALIVLHLTTAGSIVGERFGSSITLLHNVRAAVRTAATILVPQSGILSALLLGAVVLLVARGILGLLSRHTDIGTLVASGVAYVGAIVLAATLSPLNDPDARLLFPAVLPLVAAIAATAARQRAPRWQSRLLGCVGLLSAVSLLVASVDKSLDDGASVWTDASIRADLDLVLPLDVPVHSNAPDVLWFHTGTRQFWLPVDSAYRSSTRPEELDRFRTYLQCAGAVVLVWLDDTPHGATFPDLDQIVASMPVHQIDVTTPGLRVLEVNPGLTPRPPCPAPQSFGSGTGVR